jgi:hypothetical protein
MGRLLDLIPRGIFNPAHQEFIDPEQSLALIGYNPVMLIKVLAFFQHLLVIIHFREVGRHLA